MRNAEVYECPSDIGLPAKDVLLYQVTPQDKEYAAKHYGLSYSMNYMFIDSHTKQTLVLDTVRRQREVLYLIHESRDTINDGGYNWGTYDDPAPTHNLGTTAIYLDGHAAWKSTTALRQDKKVPVFKKDGKEYFLWDPTWWKGCSLRKNS